MKKLMTAEQLQDVKVRLGELREKDVVIKDRIQKKLEHCRRLVSNCLQRTAQDHESEIIKLELGWIDELITGYNRETEFLLKEDLLKINKIYNRYKVR
jgi:hypothetical protein